MCRSSRHRAPRRGVGELTASAPETDAEAWQEAKQLWLAELDAQTNARQLNADAAEHALIAAERQAFGEWLAAREALLNVLYPDQPAVVQEGLSQAYAPVCWKTAGIDPYNSRSRPSLRRAAVLRGRVSWSGHLKQLV